LSFEASILAMFFLPGAINRPNGRNELRHHA